MTTLASTKGREWPFLAFLRQELAPRPGRLAAVARIGHVGAGAEQDTTIRLVVVLPVVGVVVHLADRVTPHERDNPVSDCLPTVHGSVEVLDIEAVLDEQVGEGVVIV